MWLLLPAALGVALVVGLVAGDDDSDAPVDGPPAAPLSERPGTIRSAGDGELGIEIAVPRGWKPDQASEGLRLSSPGGDADLTVIASGEPGEMRGVVESEIAAIEETYDEAEILQPLGGTEQQIGEYHARSAVVEASDGDEVIRILVAAATTDRRTYLIEVRYPADGALAALSEAQAALSTLRLE